MRKLNILFLINIIVIVGALFLARYSIYRAIISHQTSPWLSELSTDREISGQSYDHGGKNKILTEWRGADQAHVLTYHHCKWWCNMTHLYYKQDNT